MLCLCPNHHAQLDSYSFYIDPDTFTIVGLDDNPKESISKSIKHKVNAEYLKYHKEQYLKHN